MVGMGKRKFSLCYQSLFLRVFILDSLQIWKEEGIFLTRSGKVIVYYTPATTRTNVICG